MTDDQRWEAVLARNRSADGAFVYAVRSTGVFCRPSCPSRRPGRARVQFFATGTEAAEHGYRACLRCRPLELTSDLWPERILRACRVLANRHTGVTLASLARVVGGSAFHLQRTFTRVVGVSPREFAEARRFDAVRRRLREGADVTTAFVEAGYGSSSRFYERDSARLGMAPSRYRAGGAGTSIRYASVRTAVGWLLVAATEQGICAVLMADREAELLPLLRREFPAAGIEPGGRTLSTWLGRLVRSLGGQPPSLDLPVDIRASAFQWQVWKAIQAIPLGETRTYGALAAAIGRPGASRAVARACATNPIALLVPCHRVVPAAGGSGGYRWGADRKVALLERERRHFR
ncbi:MAG: bifunctional DNA-binding transcriptional regulator/O6-methylguanine-DNA methyltransferase Ada [Vicinamibacterales bacterium]